MFAYPTGSGVLVHAPAKVNLFLEVMARRGDGFHEIETLLGAVTLFDSLEFVPRNDGELRLRCRWVGGPGARDRGRRTGPAQGTDDLAGSVGDLPVGEGNLVYRAVSKLREHVGADLGAEIFLTKRIPSAAGLGGASSDAAAALVAANVAWRLHLPLARLEMLAAELGSDVPYFLHGGWAVCRGRGERVEPGRGGRLHLVVVRPPVGLGTAPVYERCQPAATPRSVSALQAGLSAGNWRAIRNGMFNRLTAAAISLRPEVGLLQARFRRVGCIAEQMSGSGSSFFGICRTARHARRVAAQLRSHSVGEAFQATVAGRSRLAVARSEGEDDSAS